MSPSQPQPLTLTISVPPEVPTHEPESEPPHAPSPGPDPEEPIAPVSAAYLHLLAPVASAEEEEHCTICGTTKHVESGICDYCIIAAEDEHRCFHCGKLPTDPCRCASDVDREDAERLAESESEAECGAYEAWEEAERLKPLCLGCGCPTDGDEGWGSRICSRRCYRDVISGR